MVIKIHNVGFDGDMGVVQLVFGVFMNVYLYWMLSYENWWVYVHYTGLQFINSSSLNI